MDEYDIKSVDDIQEALKDLLGGTIQSMLEAEMDDHLGYEPYERSDSSNTRNGKKQKAICSKYGQMSIQVPQDRDSSFEPQVVKKRHKDVPNIDDKIISMYAKGLSTRQISDQTPDIYALKSAKEWFLILQISYYRKLKTGKIALYLDYILWYS